MIYHITSKPEWTQAQNNGAYRASSLDTQGFIHFSKASQITNVANLFYSGQDNLVILCVDENRLKSEVKWEPPDMVGHEEKDQPHGQELFPHVYGEVDLDAVAGVVDFPPDEHGIFQLPDAIAKMR